MSTLRARFEQELLHNKDPLLLELIFKHLETSEQFLCITTLAEGEIIYVNQTFRDYVGYSEDEVFTRLVTIKPLWDSPEKRGEYVKLLQRYKAVHNMEQRFRDKYGRFLTYVVSSELITLFGEPCIITSGRDISFYADYQDYELNRSMEDLHQTLQALNNLVIKLKLREDGQLEYVLAEGKIAYETGYTTANSYGKTVDELFPGLMDIEGPYFQRVLAGESVSFEIELGNRILYKTLSPFREQNQIVGIIGSAVDITERKRLERLLQTSNINSALGQMAAGAAHEIRNPLTSIKGFVQLLGELCRKNGLNKGDEYVELILSELSRINQLVTEMLWLRKPKPFSMETFSLHTFLDDVIPLINVEAHLKSIRVVVNISSKDAALEGNSASLKQVMINLCKNGIEAMTEGGVLSITAAPMKGTDRVMIEIRDTGPGIPETMKDQLFNPFFTTKATGNGLGLFIANQIITEMGGSLHIDSDSSGTKAIVQVKGSNPS